MNVIAVCNQKGGVGKTSSTINLGACLAKKGKKVLLIDADPQYSMTVALGNPDPDEDIEITLANILVNIMNDEEDLNKNGYAIVHHTEGFDYLPANSDLQGIEFEMNHAIGKDLILQKYVKTLDYDYVLIDCEPSLQNMSINSLAASDGVVIPTCAHYLSVKGLQQLFKTIRMIKRRLNNKLSIWGIFVTMFDSRTNFQKDIVNKINLAYGDSSFVKVYENKIPSTIKIAESSAMGTSVIEYAPNSKGAIAYKALAKEVFNL